jgi:hypothetical protein
MSDFGDAFDFRGRAWGKQLAARMRKRRKKVSGLCGTSWNMELSFLMILESVIARGTRAGYSLTGT